MAKTVELLIKINDGGGFKKIEVDGEAVRRVVQGIKADTERLSGDSTWTQTSQAVASLTQRVEGLRTTSAQSSAVFKSAQRAAQTSASGMSEAYSRAYENIRAEMEAGTIDIKQSITKQRKIVADLQKQLAEATTKQGNAVTKHEQGFYVSKADSLREELKGEQQALAALEQAQTQYKQSTASVRQQLTQLRNEMARLRMEGKQQTPQYEAMRVKMEQLGTTYRQLQTEQQALSTGATQWGGAISGLQGLIGLYSAGSGVVSLFTKDNEKLMAVQTKMQAVMAIMMGMQATANTLHATSAFRIVTVRKATELWSAAQNKLTVSLGVSTVAAKAFMAAATLGLSVAIGLAVSAVDKLVSKHQEQAKAQAEAAKAEEDAQKTIRTTVAGSISSQLVEYRKLQTAWAALEGNARRQTKFVKDNQTAFKNLGVSVRTVRDAENLLVDNESTFVQALRNKAMAAAAMEAAAAKYKAAIEKMLEAEKAKEITDDDRKKATQYASEVYISKIPVNGNAVARGMVSGQEKQIKQDAYKSVIATYGEKRAAEIRKAADKEMAEGDKYFDLLREHNAEAKDLLTGAGITSTEDAVDPAKGKAGSIALIEEKLKTLRAALKKASAEERASIQQDIVAWQKKLDVINAELDALSIPTDPSNIEELDKAISFYEKKLKTVGASERAEIQTTINGYREKKVAIEAELAALSVPQNPRTLDELNKALSYYRSQLGRVGAEQRAMFQEIVNDLEQQVQDINVSLAALKMPDDIAKLNTLEKLENAISYYSERQRRASADEIEDIQRTIDALEAKKAAMERAVEIPSMQRQTAELASLSGKKLRLELELVGLSEIQSKIRGLQRMLADTKNPLGNAQREEVNRLIVSYKEYEGILKKSQISVSGAWGAVKGLGSGVQSITDALENNGSAWEKVTGIIDGVLGLYQNFMTVVEIVKTLTAASAAHAAMKATEAAAETTEMGVNTAAAATAIANSAAVTTATGIETTAHVANAAAKTMSAHASIPWVGIAIGAAMVGTLIAVMASLPKFADGGIAYGPTLGIFGEYAGASHNPEVVAPLDRLRALIGDNDGPGGKVEFKVKGRRLVGVLEKERSIRKRG